MLSAILFFLLLFTPLIFLHELGHYVAARMCKVRVEAFSVGFGKVVWKTERWGTEWRLSAVPFGGYVKMAGENHSDDRQPDADELWAKSPWQRAFIAFAGPAVNLTLPILVITWFLLGGHHVVAPIIGGVNAGSAAARAGIQSGDRVLRVNGSDVDEWSDLSSLVSPAAGRALTLEIQRGDEVMELSATPDSKTVEDPLGGLKQRGMLGITSSPQAPVIIPKAGQKGLRPFDQITAVDGKKIHTLAQLQNALKGRSEAILQVRRDASRKPGERINKERAKSLEVPWQRTLEVAPFFGGAELVVEGTKDKSPAALIGLRAGDRITHVHGLKINTWSELEQHLLSSENFTAPIKVVRPVVEGEPEVLSMELGLREAEVKGPLRSSRQVMDHGIVRTFWHAPPTVEKRQLGLLGAMGVATARCVEITATMAEGLRRILVGRVSVKQIGGPVMLYDIASEVSKTSDSFWHWFNLLSLNLGLMNLLPVPVLDGGLILLSFIEILRRRPLTVAMREKANYVGLALVLTLMLTAVFNDLVRVFSS